MPEARAHAVPVIGYDRLIEAPGVFYLSFDNREVGRLQARAIAAIVPKGRIVFIKGAPTPRVRRVALPHFRALGRSLRMMMPASAARPFQLRPRPRPCGREPRRHYAGECVLDGLRGRHLSQRHAGL